MSFLIGGLGYILPFLVVLTVLVFVHEMGHYLVARRNGVKIEVFSIGFGPELFGWYDSHGTRWRVSGIPFGGYVKMFGDADAASTPGEDLATMNEAERAVSFHHKTLGQRAAILFAGPAANFLFAIIVLAGLFMTFGEPYTSPEVSLVVPDSAAAAAGIQPHDVFVSVDGQTVNRFEDLSQAVMLNTGTPMAITLLRDGKEVSLSVTPKVTEIVDRFGNHNRMGVLGVQSNHVNYTRRGPLGAIWEAGKSTWDMSIGTLRGLGQMISGARSTDEIGGPLRIAKMSGEVAQGGIGPILSFMAILSVNLGLINLFPIPVLDGGHLLFYAAEALLGRPLGRRTQEVGFRVGLALVLTLMVFATWNDLGQLKIISFLKSLVT
jgi:regulator of sigma E protease